MPKVAGLLLFRTLARGLPAPLHRAVPGAGYAQVLLRSIHRSARTSSLGTPFACGPRGPALRLVPSPAPVAPFSLPGQQQVRPQPLGSATAPVLLL